jgi:Mlc titration factor MtfA (ptsG expression regulator)
MLFSWLRARRRGKLLAEPFPAWWLAILERNVGHYALLSVSEQARLRDVTRILIAEKRWLGRGGIFVSEEMKVTIAAQAGLLLLGADHGYFGRVRDVVVFPADFRTPVASDDWEDDGLSETPLAGQAVERGPVLLAWDQALAEGRDPDAGYNVIIHEFAHQLDFLDGASQGVPVLHDRDLETRWHDVMSTCYEDHRRALREGTSNGFFTAHAADNESEFFADATESFFCRPHDLQHLLPELYQLLAAYYQVDPTRWFRDASE